MRLFCRFLHSLAVLLTVLQTGGIIFERMREFYNYAKRLWVPPRASSIFPREEWMGEIRLDTREAEDVLTFAPRHGKGRATVRIVRVKKGDVVARLEIIEAVLNELRPPKRQ